jgi:thioredoxin-related protein
MRKIIFLLVISAAAILAGCDRNSTGGDTTQTAVQPVGPPVNLAAEIERAKTENKLLLLEFGSSDACPPCVEFQKRVFSQPEFLAYEKSNLVFVRIDFPFRTTLPVDVNTTNALLSQQFDVPGFPTFVAIDHAGKEIWRMPAKGELNPTLDVSLFQPKAFIALLDTLKAKQN